MDGTSIRTNERRTARIAAVVAAVALARFAPAHGQSPPTSAPAELPPSSVSPAIERFLKASGRDLPAPTPIAIGPAEVRPPAETPGAGLPPTPSLSPRPLSGRTPGVNPSLGGNFGVRLSPAPTEPSDLRFPINLATALRLADARPLVVAAAQAGVWIAEAELTRAKVLWVPTAMFGFDYLRHDGGGPDFNKGIITAPSTNYFIAGGSADLYVNLSDAIFEPRVARQELNARHYDVQTSKNDALQRTADAYFRVHEHRGRYSGALYAVERGKELVREVAELSRDLVSRDEVDRAQNMLADLEQRTSIDRQEWRVASADLTQVLRLDPRAVVVPTEHDHAQITLIDPGRTLDDLMGVALKNRPEVASRGSLVDAAAERVRRERSRPRLPLLTVTGFQTPGMLLQGGIFGLGPNSSLDQFRGRADVSFQLLWQLEGLGFGNLARIKQQRGRQSQAIIDLRDAQDMVAADVNRALSRMQSAAARLLQADRALRTGIITFNGHLEGLRQTKRLGNMLVLAFRPQEAVYSLQLMNVAFEEYFTSVADYNRSQFELFHAVGYPAREVGLQRIPGDVFPVDTRRPVYLPPVGNGPPPATR